MPRQSRLKFEDPRSGYYHIVSRTVLKSFLLDDVAKEEFMAILKKLSRVYLIKIVTYTLMSNHFHIIVRMLPQEDVSDKDMKQRHHHYYNEGVSKLFWQSLHPEKMEYFRNRFGDLSKFVQDLKQRFSRWFNKKYDNHGHVWGERFTSVLLESGRALTACMVYVELNSLRAGIVDRPEDYRWSGLANYMAGGRAASWLDHETLAEKMLWRVELYDQAHGTGSSSSSSGNLRTKSLVKRYLELVYREGMVERPGKVSIREETVERALAENFDSLGVLSFRRRIRHFTEGVFLGGKGFCEEQFTVFHDYFATEKERKGQPIIPRRSVVQGGLLDIYSIRKLT